MGRILGQPAGAAAVHRAPPAAPPPRPLEPLPGDFSPNPGELTLHTYLPPNLPMSAPLVVLLHGCGQDPEGFATQSGWRALALHHHFALLMPGQTEANNRQRCFNWFRPGDAGRGRGEAASVVAMIAAVLRACHGDGKRVFVTGLSAGGAMAANLLAAYPDLFAGGAVVAGLPAVAARDMVSAMARMAGHGTEHSAGEWARRARELAPAGFTGPWPLLSVWHGLEDGTVAPENGIALARQFAALHEVNQAVTVPVGLHGSQHTVWGAAEAPSVEFWQLAGAGHTYPTRETEGVAAASEIARFWGLVP